MLEQKYRSYYQKLCIDPVLKHACSIEPTTITIISGVVGVLIIPALYWHHELFAIFILLLSGYLDTLDGSIARACGTSSQFGGVLDIVMDRIVEGAVVFGLLIMAPERSIACFMMLFANLLCITSFLVVGVFTQEASNKSFFYHNGLIERAEAFILYIMMILIPTYFHIIAYSYTVLVLLSAFLHLKFFYHWQKNNSCSA